MLWCDVIGSTPAIGVRLDRRFLSGDQILQALSPILKDLYDGDRPTFATSKQGAFDVSINTEAGYIYAIDDSNVSVTYRYTMKMRYVSGGPPEAELTSIAAPYTELVDKVFGRLEQALELIGSVEDRSIERIGLIASTVSSYDRLPPGVQKMIDYFGRPWPKSLDNYNLNMIANLDETGSHIDRCIHNLIKQDGVADNLITTQLDWQRKLKHPRALTNDNFRDLFRYVQLASTNYFQNFAEGELLDAISA